MQQWLIIKQDPCVTFYCSIKFHISLVDYQKAKWLIFQCDVSLFLVGMNTIRYSMAIFYSNFFLLCNVFLSDKPPFVKYYEFDVSDETDSHKNVARVISHTPSHLKTDSVWKLPGYEMPWCGVEGGIMEYCYGESSPVIFAPEIFDIPHVKSDRKFRNFWWVRINVDIVQLESFSFLWQSV